MRLGADPEVFLQDENKSPVSVIGYIGANKWNPMQIPNMEKGFTLQEDNVALEYGIPPASSPDEFKTFIKQVMVASKPYIKGLSFSQESCLIFPEHEMRHPDAHQFGCEPDFNAWTGRKNPRPIPEHQFMRSAGGHVHVETKRNPYEVVRLLDLFLGVPATLMDNGEQRKKLYGKMGACRRKPYGVEYRVLSNFWIFKDELVEWVWRNIERALSSNINPKDSYTLIKDAINNNNKKVAQSLVNEFSLDVI